MVYNDFETHPRGTSEEIRLSRELVASLVDFQDDEKLSDNSKIALNKLRMFYGKQIERGEM